MKKQSNPPPPAYAHRPSPPPAPPDLVNQINNHLQQLAPHVRDRDSAKLLTAARIEIDRLRLVIQKAKERGEASENPFYEMMTLLNENA